MNNSIPTRYVTKKKLSYKTLSRFVREVISHETQKYTTAKLYSKVICIPFFSNGYTSIIKASDHFVVNISINLFPFITCSLSSELKFFYLYVTILHEVEHIELVLNANNNFNDYPRTLAILENLGKKYHLTLSRFFHPPKNKYRRNTTSSLELECVYQSIQKAIPLFQELLSKKESEHISLVSSSLSFLRNHLEIGYLSHSTPYNKFVHSFVNLCKRNKSIEYLLDNECRFLQNIFKTNGELKGIEQIYKNISYKNKEVFDPILFHIFLYSNTDFSSLFHKSPEIKQYVETLINSYYDNFIDFIEKRTIGEIFVDKELLNDNENMKLKNINYLNMLIEKYHMECNISIMTHST